jgi:Ice-binding-like
VRRILFNGRFLGLVLLAILAAVWPMAALAASPPGLGSASNFAVLSAAPLGGGAVTCTNGTITGDVGSSGPAASVVQTSCTINGAVIAPVPAGVVADFNTAYAAYTAIPCGTTLTGTLAGVTLAPGVYCFDAAATLTGTLTLKGPSSGTWIFKIGAGTTPPTGALTGTGFTVVMAGGAVPCNVNWWVAEAATMTDSNFIGTILAGAAITLTRGTFSGDILAKAGVTITGTSLVGCAAAGGKGHGNEKAHCNQGVGNGPEGCDPGNSNNHNTSNDELGGTPGDPGRQGPKNGDVAATMTTTISIGTSNVTSDVTSNANGHAMNSAAGNTTSKAGKAAGKGNGKGNGKSK